MDMMLRVALCLGLAAPAMAQDEVPRPPVKPQANVAVEPAAMSLRPRLRPAALDTSTRAAAPKVYPRNAGFERWLRSYRRTALNAGVSGATYDRAVRDVLQEVFDQAMQILTAHRDILDETAEKLLDLETLDEAALREVAGDMRGEDTRAVRAE